VLEEGEWGLRDWRGRLREGRNEKQSFGTSEGFKQMSLGEGRTKLMNETGNDDWGDN
jgi:hypothetical protein